MAKAHETAVDRPALVRWALAALAAGTLIGGFAAATATGSRPVGGIVLLVGGTACTWLAWRRVGWLRALACLGVALVAFIASHPLGEVVGSWPAVVLVSALTAVAVSLVTGNRRSAR